MSKYHSALTKKGNYMRLFIASPVILDDYTSIKEDFKDIIEGKWVKEQNLHLTWVFLGDVEEVKPVIDTLKGISPLEHQTRIKELGYFGRPPKIFFARSEEKTLFDLYRFKPHLTLCRIKTIHDYKAYKEKLKTYRERSLGWILPDINLYESTLSSEGAHYSCRYTLKKT